MLSSAALALAFAVPPTPPPRPAALEIEWAAPPECPDADALRERVLGLVELDEAGGATLYVEGTIAASDGTFELRLRTALGELEDERAVRDADCGALVEAAALFVAVSVDPVSQAPTDTPSDPEPRIEPTVEPAPEPETTRIATVASPPPTPPIEADEPIRAFRGPDAAFVAVAPQVEFGMLPGVTGGPRLSLGLQWDRASVAVYGLYGAPRQTDVVLGASGLAQVGAAGLMGCGNPLSGDLRLPLCAVVEGGGVRVASRGLDPPKRVSSPWTAAGARVGVERRWDRVGLFSSVETLVPVVRTDVLLGDVSAFTTWAVSLRLVLGVKIFLATDST